MQKKTGEISAPIGNNKGAPFFAPLLREEWDQDEADDTAENHGGLRPLRPTLRSAKNGAPGFLLSVEK